MEEMKYVIRKSGQANYLVLCPQREKVPVFELEYLNRNHLQGCLPYEIMIQGGRIEFWYRLTGCNSVKTLLGIGRIDAKELKKFLTEVVEFSEELEGNFLNPMGLVLDLESVFYSEEKKRFLYAYNPEESIEIRVSLLNIVEELLTMVDYKKKEMISVLYQAYEVLNQENADYSKLKEIKSESQGVEVKESLYEDAEETTDFLSEENDNFSQEYMETIKGSYIENVKKILEDYLKKKFLGWRKKADKKFNSYKEIKPVLIHPYDADTDCPTILLTGDSEVLMKERQYCLKTGNGEENIFLNKKKIVLGKAIGKVDQVISGDGVSRIHAFIIKEDNGYYLEDLNSLNGTFINGERLNYKERVCLKDNDKIGIGEKTFCFCAI